MRVGTGHIIFDKNINYIDLASVYQGLLTEFLEETGQMPEENDQLYMHIRLGLMDLENNRKPEGFRWNSGRKLLFPLRYCEPGEYCQPVELYVITGRRGFEITDITESLSSFLDDNNIKHDVSWDDLEKKINNGFKPLHSFQCPKRGGHIHRYPLYYNVSYRSNITPISVLIDKSTTTKKEVLDIPRWLGKVTNNILDYVTSNPGEIQSDIGEVVGVGVGNIGKHLKILKDLGYVHILPDKIDKRKKRVFPSGSTFEKSSKNPPRKPPKKYPRKSSKTRGLRETARVIFDYVKEHPGEIQKDIGEILCIPVQNVNYNIKSLASSGFIRIGIDEEDKRQRRIYPSA